MKEKYEETLGRQLQKNRVYLIGVSSIKQQPYDTDTSQFTWVELKIVKM